MMAGHGLSDKEWLAVEDLFSRRKRTLRPLMPARDALTGIGWILRTGAACRDLPVESG